jgi:hypothetical protein
MFLIFRLKRYKKHMNGNMGTVRLSHKHTEVSLFIADAENEYLKDITNGSKPRPFHLILDEMNLARIEYL